MWALDVNKSSTRGSPMPIEDPISLDRDEVQPRGVQRNEVMVMSKEPDKQTTPERWSAKAKSEVITMVPNSVSILSSQLQGPV